MTSERSLDVVIVGLGVVGRALVEQFRGVADRLRSERGIELRMVGLVDRGGLLYRGGGLPDRVVDDALRAKLRGESIGAVRSAMPPARRYSELATLRTLFVDATAASGMAAVWREVIESGAGVVLANKLPLCEAWSESGPLFNHPRVRYEATVGAGLPVLSTLRALLATGDSIERMDGALSGTLGYLVGRMSGSVAFSEALAEAIDLGYAEPDPSEDLSGRDVARKAVILSRSAGWQAELAEVALEGLIPDSRAREMTPPAAALSPDDALRGRFADAERDGDVLRYLARVSPDGIRVGLAPVPRSDSFAAIAGPENRVAFHTRRYAPHPLAVAGPGAGPDVTAAGVLNDLIDLAETNTMKGETSCPR